MNKFLKVFINARLLDLKHNLYSLLIMVYCELCESEFSEAQYQHHLMECIENTNPFTETGFPNHKAPLIFPILQRNYGYKGIITYLNKESPVFGGWVNLLFLEAPDLIIDAYIQAIHSDDQKIAIMAKASIEFAFLSLIPIKYDLDNEDANVIVFITRLIEDNTIKEIIASRFKTIPNDQRQHFLDHLSQLKYYGESGLQVTVNYHKKKLVEFISKL